MTLPNAVADLLDTYSAHRLIDDFGQKKPRNREAHGKEWRCLIELLPADRCDRFTQVIEGDALVFIVLAA